MALEGGCYCGAVRYSADGDPMMKAQCHCRECQYISGGGPNFVMMMPRAGFAYTKGEPKQFTRTDLEVPATREFCGVCGTHIATHRPGRPVLALKVGTLDDPGVFGAAQVATFTADKQTFHHIAAGIATFERLPGG